MHLAGLQNLASKHVKTVETVSGFIISAGRWMLLEFAAKMNTADFTLFMLHTCAANSCEFGLVIVGSARCLKAYVRSLSCIMH